MSEVDPRDLGFLVNPATGKPFREPLKSSGHSPILPARSPRIPTNLSKPNGPLRRWAARLYEGGGRGLKNKLGEDPADPTTWVKDALWEDACAETLKIHNTTGYGRQQ